MERIAPARLTRQHELTGKPTFSRRKAQQKAVFLKDRIRLHLLCRTQKEDQITE